MIDDPTAPEERRLRLAVLVNTVAPYRLPTYAALAQRFETLVLHGGAEPNRTWSQDSGPYVNLRKVWTIQIPMRKRTGIKGIGDISYIHFNAGLLWELPRFRPDVIISNELGLRTCLAFCYAKLRGIPHWVWWGGTLHSERHASLLRRMVRRVLARSIYRWISYGASSTEYLLSLGIAREQVLQVQNCVPHETFASEPAPTRAWFSGEPTPLLVSTGQLIARKGLDKLIQACGRLAARGRRFTLVLVGEGPEREKLDALARANRLEHFHILPNQSQTVLNELYHRANVLVFPTLEDVWGLVVNEALWAGCPVLCSIYAGCAGEIVPEGNLFDPMSAESFDTALDKVFNHSLVPASSSAGALLTHQQVSAAIIRSLLTDTLQNAEDTFMHGLTHASELTASDRFQMPDSC